MPVPLSSRYWTYRRKLVTMVGRLRVLVMLTEQQGVERSPKGGLLTFQALPDPHKEGILPALGRASPPNALNHGYTRMDTDEGRVTPLRNATDVCQGELKHWATESRRGPLRRAEEVGNIRVLPRPREMSIRG